MSFLQSKLKWIAAAMSLIYAALVLALSLAWYKDQMIEPFHFFNDLPEWKQLDKLAHFFWTFQVSALVFRLLSWGGWQSAKWASLIGFVLVSSVEIPDGFSAGYGASIFDLVANALGAGCFFAQMHFFKSIRFFAKFSFHATPYAIQRPSLLGDGFLQELLKDYNGQTFWYAWAPAIKFWPRWLSLAVGLGAEGMIYGRDAENLSHGFVPFRKIVFSVDLNFASLKFERPWLQAITYPFHIIKFPAPALEVSERGWKFHWLYF
ncbi:MAG: DUF2279 domain-containing protein [Bacteroidota bacterium]|nr:DUF2279 domain-containing protein [Cytophagales bacterium]MCE2957040.1 YfiM family protein [Flammeovirgaceae bacterium]MCZ8068879.1 DUF2279 domain-containing protein [Cytophagales bacterium]